MSKAKALAEHRRKPCLVCGTTPTDVAHIRTKKASGIDEPFNYYPLCRKHHAEQHSLGVISFLVKYPKVFSYVIRQGWSVEVVNGKSYLRRGVE